ncbi:MAG: DUF1700 domain-containing protein [Bacilli bacterium]|jgi:uncharacterized membrane protein
MTKKKFLKELKDQLSNLEQNEVDEIISKYETIIDQELKDGKKEKDVVASLGSVEMIAKLYTKSTKEEPSTDTNNDNTTKSTTLKVIDKILKYMDDAFKKVDDKLAKRILTILCFVCVGFIGISLLHIPFIVIETLGFGLFRLIFSNNFIYGTVSVLWSLSLNICYFILVLWIAIYYINQIVLRYTTINLTKINNWKKELTKKEDNEKGTADILHSIFKVIIVLLTIPLITFDTILFTILFANITLIMNGVILFGPLMIIMGIIFLVSTLINVIYKSVFKGGLN